MATPTIPNGEEHFFPIIYEGNGAGQRVGKFVPFTDSGTIANSCIFNRFDSATMSRTLETPTNGKIWTFSTWYKRGNLDSNICKFLGYSASGGGGYMGIVSDKFYISDGIQSGSFTTTLAYHQNRTLEDTSKWYHFVVAVDTTLSTASDRVKIYIDGNRVTSFDSYTTHPAQDLVPNWNGGSGTLYIGRRGFDTTNLLDGYMAEMNFVDGQALTPASFGVTDTSTGRWIPSVVKPYPTTTTDIAVTVVSSGGNKYALDGVTQGTVTLIEGATYKFDQSDSSNSGHPLRFSTTSNGTHGGGSEYTTGVTTVGTPGSSGAYTQITVAVGAPTLYYYCTNHSGMGGTANTQDQYGNSGWRLKFQDSSALGDDTSGNGNDFTATNLTASDQTIGSPTSNYSNFTTNGSTGTISLAEGNLKPTFSSSAGDASGSAVPSTFRIPVGKWYFEYYIAGTNSVLINWAVAKTNTNFSGRLFTLSGFKTYHPYVRSFYEGGSELITATDMPIGEDDTTVGFYIERKSDGTLNLWAGDDQVSKGTFAFQSSMNPATGANAVGNPFSPNDELRLYIGNDGNGNYSSGVRGTFNFGQLKVSPIDSGTNLTDYTSTAGGYFRYQPVTGFKALQQDNLPETAKGISGSVWIKNRDATDSWIWQDSLRGKSEYGSPASATQYNTAITDGVQKFLKGGVQIEGNDAVNTSGESYVAFNWVLNNGTNVTDTSGDLSTELQANPTAGVSVGKFTVSGSGNKTWAHGLGGVPEVGILCAYNSTNSGTFYHHKISTTPYNNGLFLTNTNSAFTSSNIWGSAKPTSTLWTGLVGSLFSAGEPYIFYSFRGIDGFSKFGKYVGNGSSDGPFIYTGFKPAMVMVKSSSNAATNWEIRDNKRSASGSNPITQVLYPNLNSQEYTTDNCDFLANGFKWRSSGGNRNETGYTYIYMAFAEHPFVGDGTNPVTAR